MYYRIKPWDEMDMGHNPLRKDPMALRHEVVNGYAFECVSVYPMMMHHISAANDNRGLCGLASLVTMCSGSQLFLLRTWKSHITVWSTPICKYSNHHLKCTSSNWLL